MYPLIIVTASDTIFFSTFFPSNSRARKVKCEQASGAEKCDACLLAHQECSFKARDLRFHNPGDSSNSVIFSNGSLEHESIKFELSSPIMHNGGSPVMQTTPKSASRLGSLFNIKRPQSAHGRKPSTPIDPEAVYVSLYIFTRDNAPEH